MKLIDAVTAADAVSHAHNIPLAELVDTFASIPAIDAVPVVRCKDCVWWQDRQVQLADGSCRDYMPDEPWSVTCDIGVNVGAHCRKHGFEDESGSWFWAGPDDFCSRGAKMEDKL